ncbi:alpha/beta fold hydrolase [Vibrio astriarenae]|uniref:Alpha/beta fold hydrolase n=1 Tax=Vibrio astriarenae TaxID=1481923 RepID=A0A7Z2T6B2_9VIBR|nr:alpha/beta fold hydrolase [Vibrio astriarenae]QIA64942.1 alpha/beta fold hydrolase [Vibrio astriarenae]
MKERNQQLDHRLVELIYDSALDPSHWPTLLEKIVDALSSQAVEDQIIDLQSAVLGTNGCGSFSSDCFDASSNKSNVFLVDLISHLERSAQINFKLEQTDTERELKENLFERIPLPALLFKASGELLQYNHQAKMFIEQTNLMTLSENGFRLSNAFLQRQFERNLTLLGAPVAQQKTVTMRLSESYTSQPTSMNFSRLEGEQSQQNSVMVLIANICINEDIDLVDVCKRYKLTQAETQLAKSLLASKSLNQISEDRHVTINTVRTQLKSIFKKTGCHRQSDLVRTLIANTKLQHVSDYKKRETLGRYQLESYNQTIFLRDGRTLSYSDVGCDGDDVVILIPPSTGSRYQVHPNVLPLKKHQLRLITIDRPGYGLSSPHPNRTLSSFAVDVEALLDKLNVNNASVLGYCGGGPYALAIASYLGERVNHLSLVSSVTPYEPINLFHGIKSSNKLLAQIAIRSPEVLTPLLKLIASSVVKDYEKYFDQIYPHLCESDAVALSEPAVTDNFIHAFREALRQGTASFAQDLVLLSRPWNINMQSIQCPITLWHGVLDQHVPISLARKFIQQLPNATLREEPNLGHFLVYFRWNDVLESAQKHTVTTI